MNKIFRRVKTVYAHREEFYTFEFSKWCKESAKQLLLNVEELMSKWSLGQFVTAFREGKMADTGSIVVPEGKLGCGWRGFGFHLTKINQTKFHCSQYTQTEAFFWSL